MSPPPEEEYQLEPRGTPGGYHPLPKGNLPITLSTSIHQWPYLLLVSMAGYLLLLFISSLPPADPADNPMDSLLTFTPPQASFMSINSFSNTKAIPRLLYHPTVVLPLSNPYMKQKLVQSTAGSNIEIPSPVTNYMGMEPPPPYSSHLLDWERQPVDSSTPQGGLASSDSKSGLRHRDQ